MRHVLYVDGLSKAITADQLKDLFAMYGQVPWARVARHRDKSASYGFVELTSGVQALRALVELDGTIVDDSCLQVCLMPLQSGTNGTGARFFKWHEQGDAQSHHARSRGRPCYGHRGYRIDGRFGGPTFIFKPRSMS